MLRISPSFFWLTVNTPSIRSLAEQQYIFDKQVWMESIPPLKQEIFDAFTVTKDINSLPHLFSTWIFIDQLRDPEVGQQGLKVLQEINKRRYQDVFVGLHYFYGYGVLHYLEDLIKLVDDEPSRSKK